MQEIGKTELLSRAEECELAEQIAQGDTLARDRMIRANLRLVLTVARSFLGRGLSLEDLISEGNLGLIRAVEGFDGRVGTRFSTYACFWIRQSIREAINAHGKPIRLPHYVVTLLSKWRRTSKLLAEQLGREPTDQEVSRALGLSKRKHNVVLKALETLRSLGRGDDQEEEDDSPLSQVADHRNHAVDERMQQAELSELVREGLARLPEREASIVRLRFGFDDSDPRSLGEIGGIVGLTRERVRQIEKKALSSLLSREGRPEKPGWNLRSVA